MPLDGNKAPPFDDWLSEQMRDPVFRFWYRIQAPLYWSWVVKLRQWWYKVTHQHEVDVSQELADADCTSTYDCMLMSEEALARDWTGEENDKWDKAVKQVLEEHAEAWERLAKE